MNASTYLARSDALKGLWDPHKLGPNAIKNQDYAIGHGSFKTASRMAAYWSFKAERSKYLHRVYLS